MAITENELDPSRSLQLISEVIAKTREDIKEHSFPFLLWGWLIAIASFSFFLLQVFTSFRFYFLPFPILAGAGIIATFYYYGKRRHISETWLGFYLKNLWLVLGISFLLVVFINVLRDSPPFTYTLLIGGIGTLVSGLVLRFKPLVFGGILFLLLSVTSVFVTDSYKPVLQAAAVIGGYLIPGYLLKYSKV